MNNFKRISVFPRGSHIRVIVEAIISFIKSFINKSAKFVPVEYSKQAMTTFTIDVPDNNRDEIIAQLKKLGVKIRQSKLAKLDKLTKEGYEKHFLHQSRVSRDSVLRYL